MKKLILLSILSLTIVFTSHAQEKKMSIGLGFGAAPASNTRLYGGKKYGFGINFYINWLYNLNANLSIGLEYNLNSIAIDIGDGSNFEATSITGLTPKIKYRFGENKTRFFLAFMAGLYRIRPGVFSEDQGVEYTLASQYTFGVAPEIGVQFGNSFQISSVFLFPGKYKGDPFEFTYRIWQFNVAWNINFVDNK